MVCPTAMGCINMAAARLLGPEHPAGSHNEHPILIPGWPLILPARAPGMLFPTPPTASRQGGRGSSLPCARFWGESARAGHGFPSLLTNPASGDRLWADAGAGAENSPGASGEHGPGMG